MPEQRQERHGLRAWWHGMALAGVSGVALQLQQAQLYEAAVYMGALVLSGLLLAGVMRLACGAWHWLALPLVMAGCWGWSGWLAVQDRATVWSNGVNRCATVCWPKDISGPNCNPCTAY